MKKKVYTPLGVKHSKKIMATSKSSGTRKTTTTRNGMDMEADRD